MNAHPEDCLGLRPSQPPLDGTKGPGARHPLRDPASVACHHAGMNTVRTDRDAPVLVVTIDRPAVRNAVDGPTASALADAFREFDADVETAVAVLTGAGGTFCAGADLKGVAAGTGNRVTEQGDGPLGPTRMLLSKPVVAAVEGFGVASSLELALWGDMRGAAFG